MTLMSILNELKCIKMIDENITELPSPKGGRPPIPFFD
jgi:hypothetical protein